MKKHYLILLISLLAYPGGLLLGQPYYFSQSDEAYVPLAPEDTTLITNEYWDGFSVFEIPFPLDFSYFGKTYDTLYIASGSVTFTISRTPGFTDLSGQEIGVFATFVDLRERETNSQASPISYTIDGQEGERIFKLEWKNAGLEDDNTEEDFVNLQLWLYEKDGTIEMRYGPNSVNNPDVFFPTTSGPNVGIYDNIPVGGYFLQGDPTNPTVVNNSPFPALNAVPPEGTVYRFSLMPVYTEEAQEINSFSVYPNPFDQALWVETGGLTPVTQIQLLDMSGRVLIQQNTTIDRATRIAVPDLAAGIYTLVIFQNGQLSYRKVVKQ